MNTVLLLLILSAGSATGSQRGLPPPAVPVEPIGAILDAFHTHLVVALGEGPHGNEQGHALRLALIRDPRFAAIVNDIVVECGSAKYQDVMDRFVRGDEVAYETLRQVWQNTTQTSGVWDRPIYEEFFRAVRAVNAALPRERQLRVVLSDPPVDWDDVLQGREDLGRWMRDRDTHAIEVIRREVLAKQRRALVIYGDGHLFRTGRSLLNRLEQDANIRVFTVTTATSTMFEDLSSLQPDVNSWPIPSLAIVRGTAIDARQLTYRDAVLYFGPPSAITFSRLPVALCTDPRYVEMRVQRERLGTPAQTREQIRRDCGIDVPK